MITTDDSKFLDSTFLPYITEDGEKKKTQGYWELGKYISLNTNFDEIPNKERCNIYVSTLNIMKNNYKFVCKNQIFDALPLDSENIILSYIKVPSISYKTIYKYWGEKYIDILEKWKSEDTFDIMYYPHHENDYFVAHNRLKKIDALLHLIKMSDIGDLLGFKKYSNI
jgi:hypothetical protein